MECGDGFDAAFGEDWPEPGRSDAEAQCDLGRQRVFGVEAQNRLARQTSVVVSDRSEQA